MTLVNVNFYYQKPNYVSSLYMKVKKMVNLFAFLFKNRKANKFGKKSQTLCIMSQKDLSVGRRCNHSLMFIFPSLPDLFWVNINKTAMRIMQLYRIEHEYKIHKRRLQSIQQLNSKQRVAKATSQHFYLANEHKKIKINAEIFHEREELTRREKHNELMCKTISDHSRRIRQQYESALLANLHPEKPQRRGAESDRIELENAKLREKLEKMKSVYKQSRKNSDLSLPSHHAERERARQTEKDKLVRMLKAQFKMDPIVSFPRSKAKTNSNDPEPEENPAIQSGNVAGEQKTEVVPAEPFAEGGEVGEKQE